MESFEREINSVQDPPSISPDSHQGNVPAVDSALPLQLLAALHLSSASINSGHHHHHQGLSTMEPWARSSVSNKRQSPSSVAPDQPSSKRAAIICPADPLLPGFTRIPLPSHVLSRTISSPIPYQGTKNFDDQSSNGPADNSLIDSRLPEESSGVNSAVPVPAPSQKPLYRSFSEPIPDPSQVVSSSTPPRPPAAGKAMLPSPTPLEALGSSLKQESPDAKKLKRMKEMLQEMSKRWLQVIQESEEDAGSENDDHCLPKADSEASQVKETEEESCQEAVWVEKNGEVLILHFKCPCGQGYQILLSRSDCYYKLASF